MAGTRTWRAPLGAHAENGGGSDDSDVADEWNLCPGQLLPRYSMHSIEWENPQGYGVESATE